MFHKPKKVKTNIITFSGLAVFLFSTFCLTFLAPIRATAATTAQLQGDSPKISFTFDDAYQSAYTQAEPTLAKYGLTGTDYVISGCVGMTTVPNTCNANQDATYMTWAQVKALGADGWEIGDHTVDHVCLASSGETDPSDCANPAPLTTAQIDAELANSKSAIAANTGITPTDFATPYGDYNNNVLAQISKYFATHRGFADVNNNVYPYNDYLLNDYQVQAGVTPATVETAINNAITNNYWLILTFHDIQVNASTNPSDYQYSTANLATIASYVQAKVKAGLIKDININQGTLTSTSNLLPDSDFSSGISDGWSTDSPSTITADSGNNGDYPNPTYSVHITSGSTVGHLFSPLESVTPGTTYGVKSWLNLESITSGEVGYYIDEYDANGNWISGQYKTQEVNPFVEDMNFTYTPSSASVSKVRVQLIVAANSGVNGYVDNFQLFPISSTTTSANLMPNGTFAAGIADGWSTDDPTNITANSAGNGSPSDTTYSVELNSGTRAGNGHLFSPQVPVSSADSYTVSSWLNLKTISSTYAGAEVGFYVDEYNSSGTWISGKYLGGDHTLGANTVGFTYTPSSTSVAKAALQVIVISNAGINGYLSSASWTQN